MEDMPQIPPKPTKGKSLWADALRKLRRNRVAMVCLVILALVSLGAFFTPLLPLQPSHDIVTSRSFQEPTFALVPSDRLKLKQEDLQRAAETVRELRPGVQAAREELSQARRALARVSGGSEEAVEGAEQKVEEAKELVARRKREVDDATHRPYEDAGFTRVGPVSRWLIRCRLAIFDDYSIPSICGRDSLGRDVLSRIFWGARVSIIVSLVATMVSLVIGVTYGAVSGYAGGWVDGVMMRLVDILYSVPFIFVVIFLLTILGEEQTKKQLAEYGIDRITIFYLVVGAIYWLTMARVVRGQVLSLKNEAYVEAARAQGAGHSRIVFRHLVPNVLSVVIVYLTLTIPRVMLFEAFLSFLGLGVESPDVSWGMLASEGLTVINPIKVYWWLVVWPSAAIGLTLFALNFFGDSLRDALDPKLRDS